MNIKEAQRLVEEDLEQLSREQNSVECVVLEDETIEKSWGWVFFYQSKAYVESGDELDMLAGNAPIIVNKYTGTLMHAGTAHDIAYYVQEYEACLFGAK